MAVRVDCADHAQAAAFQRPNCVATCSKDDETAPDATGTAAAAAAAASFAALHNDANPADMPPFDCATVAADEAEAEDEG